MWWQEWLDRLETFRDIFATMQIGDVIEIIIITVVLYYILSWVKTSRAWSLLRGVVVIVAFLLIANYFEMRTILWVASNVMSVALTAVVVVLQPELRRALEDLGKKNVFYSFLWSDSSRNTKGEEEFTSRTINEITRACVEMGKVRTGALIVVEMEDPLADYERTGIDVDGKVSSQLLINIFEHNTPLHDGAVIVRGNRVTSATCYLPLSDNMNLDKELGTRHRAGVGISEVTDSITVIVSEETGKISVAEGGVLESGLDADRLKERLQEAVRSDGGEEKRGRHIWKGRSRAKNGQESI